MKNANILSMIIGLVSIILGIYQLISRAEFNVYFSTLFIGIILFGSAYINYKGWDKVNPKN